jgi:hypothetical protein
MLTVSRQTLLILAAVVWHIGGIALLAKGISLIAEAETLQPGQHWQWIFASAGLLLGLLKARFLFSKFWHKNATRINALDSPRLWQFFRPAFFLMLALMIASGAALSRLAAGQYRPLIGVATLDLSLAIALLGSSLIFWRQQLIPIQTRDRR